MAYVTKIEKSRFEAKWRNLRAAIRTEGPRGAAMMGQLFVRAVDENAHKDTHRWVAGWQRAFNAAAGSAACPDLAVAVDAVRRSKYRDEFLRILIEQNNTLLRRFKSKARMLDSWYDSKGRRHDAFYNDQKRRLERLGKRIDRAAEEIDKLVADAEGTAVLMKNVNHAQIAAGNKLSNVDLSTEEAALKARLATVRVKIYGGTGRVVGNGLKWYCQLHNLEPHARVVESRFHTVAKARALVGSFGVRRVGRAMVERVAAAADGVQKSA